MRRFAVPFLLAALCVLGAGSSAWAQAKGPTFPPLTGRVVDGADMLPPAVEAELGAELAALEQSSGRQVVVVTLASLQGYEIEDYGYRLGRAWGIGDKDRDDGALLIVAPNDRKVRIEVGYGLEPVLTDAVSSVILQSTVLPRFRQGDMSGGVVAGTRALIDHLSLPQDQALAQVAKAEAAQKATASPALAVFLVILFLVMFVLPRGRRGRGGAAAALPWIILGSLGGSGRGGGGFGGGFGGGGGGFGGGGASGGW